MSDKRVEILKAILKSHGTKSIKILSEELQLDPAELREEIVALRNLGLVTLESRAK